MDTEYIRIAITFADATIGIMSFVTNSPRDGWTREANKEEIEKEIAKSSVSFDKEKLPIKNWRIIKEKDIPKDRTFRNAWVDDGKITHDMVKVREIHLDHIREARIPLLAQKDKEWMRATGQDNTQEAEKIEAERQALRDIPQTIMPDLEKAKTPEEVKIIGMEKLK